MSLARRSHGWAERTLARCLSAASYNRARVSNLQLLLLRFLVEPRLTVLTIDGCDSRLDSVSIKAAAARGRRGAVVVVALMWFPRLFIICDEINFRARAFFLCGMNPLLFSITARNVSRLSCCSGECLDVDCTQCRRNKRQRRIANT